MRKRRFKFIGRAHGTYFWTVETPIAGGGVRFSMFWRGVEEFWNRADLPVCEEARGH